MRSRIPAAAPRRCPWRSIASVRSTPTTRACPCSVALRAASCSATPAVPDATSRITPSAGMTWPTISARHRPFCPNESSSASRSYRAGSPSNRSRAKPLGSSGMKGLPVLVPTYPTLNAGVPPYGSAWAIRQGGPDLLRVCLGRVGIIVRVPWPEPEPQAIALVPGDHVQVQVRDGLAHYVVDQDHRSVRAQAVLDRALQPLGRAEELGHLLCRQLAEQPQLLFRHQQRRPAEQRPVIEERDQPLGLQDGHGRPLAADDGTEG